MRLAARDYEGFLHLCGLLNEAGIDGVPIGGNELVVPDDATVADPELRAELALVLMPGSADVFASLPSGGSDGPGPEPAAAGVGGAPAQARPVNPPAAPMPIGDRADILGPTPVAQPPRTGPGSGTQAWLRYATSLRLDIPPDTPRDQIIEQVDQHLAGPQPTTEATP